MVDNLHALMIRREPDLTLVIDMDPTAALDRGLARNSGEDRFEDLGADFQIRLRKGFIDLCDEFPDRCRLIDGTGTPEDVSARVWTQVQAFLA